MPQLQQRLQISFGQVTIYEGLWIRFVYVVNESNLLCKHRYKIHLKVTDRTGDTTFILFNAVAEKLLDTSAHKLFNKLTTANNDVPVQVQSLCGKEFVFKLRLNHYNLKEGLENFTISKLWIPDDNLEVQYKLRKEEKVLQYRLWVCNYDYIYFVIYFLYCSSSRGRTYPKMKLTQKVREPTDWQNM